MAGKAAVPFNYAAVGTAGGRYPGRTTAGS